MRSDIPTFVHRAPLRASYARSFFEVIAVSAILTASLLFMLAMSALGVFGALYLFKLACG